MGTWIAIVGTKMSDCMNFCSDAELGSLITTGLPRKKFARTLLHTDVSVSNVSAKV